MKISHTAVIADDSGLEVDYLNGAPGVYSHRYAEKTLQMKTETTSYYQSFLVFLRKKEERHLSARSAILSRLAQSSM